MPKSGVELVGGREVLTLQMVKHWSSLVASEPAGGRLTAPLAAVRAEHERRRAGAAATARESSTTAVTRPRTLPR